MGSYSNIKGWEGTSIEVGWGGLYRCGWGSQVVEMDSSKNYQITQRWNFVSNQCGCQTVNGCHNSCPDSTVDMLNSASSCATGLCDSPMCLCEAKSKCPKIDVNTLMTPEFNSKVNKLKLMYGENAQLDMMVVEDRDDDILDE